jgi:pSer/pThr/pTyr-binding forkhead associated (FHA) protein
MKLSLVVMTAGKTTGQTIPVTLAQFIIGRDPQCNLRPASPVISKRHCALITKGGKVVLRDLESTNGTFINDKPLKGECVINNGDVMKVGPLAFKVVIETSTPVNKPTPPPAKLAAPGASEDDDVANMLLSLQDDTGTSSESTAASEPSVPEGSTVMDMMPLGDTKKDEEAKKEEEAAKATLKKEAPKPAAPPGDARSAAAALLQKYSRRER